MKSALVASLADLLGEFSRCFQGPLWRALASGSATRPAREQTAIPAPPLLEPTPRVEVTHLSCLLLKLLNGPLVNPPTLVDEVPGSGGLAGSTWPMTTILMCVFLCPLRWLLPSVTAPRGRVGERGEVRESWQAAASHSLLLLVCLQHPSPCCGLLQSLGQGKHQLKK